MTETNEAKRPTIEDVPQGTVSEVMSWVGDDAERCDLAIAAEKVGKQRATLLTSLEAHRRTLAEQAQPAADTEQVSAPGGTLDDLKLYEQPAVNEPPRPNVTPGSNPAAADAAQVASQVDSDAVRPAEAPQADDEPKGDTPCEEHFPNGWDTPVITRTEAVTGIRQPSVTCEHGTYKRSR